MSLLSRSEIQEGLENLKGWKYMKDAISKEYIFDSYMDGISFINLLAVEAEENNHHPDMIVGWCKINLTFTSHDLGGITEKCLKMAQAADKIYY